MGCSSLCATSSTEWLGNLFPQFSEHNTATQLLEQRSLRRVMKGFNKCIYGRFHVKGPRKKVNVEKWIFFEEM